MFNACNTWANKNKKSIMFDGFDGLYVHIETEEALILLVHSPSHSSKEEPTRVCWELHASHSWVR